MTAEPQKLHPEPPTIDHADIRWRVGQISKKDPHKGSLLGYIDARTCMEALDALDPNWSAVHGDPIVIGDVLMGVPCALTVNGITRSDVGMPSSQEPIKGAYSDALKRAAVHHGIGRELYELPRIYVKLDEYKKPVATPTYRNGRWTLPSGAGSVFYDREPDEQPDRGDAGSRPRGATRVAPVPGPVQRTPEEKALLGDMIARATQPDAGVPPAPARTVGEGSASPPSIDTPHTGNGHPDSSGPDAATPSGSGDGSPPSTSEPAAAPTDDEILAAAGPGAEIVPPKSKKGRSVEEAIADAKQKAAKGEEPTQESLAAALGAPEPDR